MCAPEVPDDATTSSLFLRSFINGISSQYNAFHYFVPYTRFDTLGNTFS